MASIPPPINDRSDFLLIRNSRITEHVLLSDLLRKGKSYFCLVSNKYYSGAKQLERVTNCVRRFRGTLRLFISISPWLIRNKIVPYIFCLHIYASSCLRSALICCRASPRCTSPLRVVINTASHTRGIVRRFGAVSRNKTNNNNKQTNNNKLADVKSPAFHPPASPPFRDLFSPHCPPPHHSLSLRL